MTWVRRRLRDRSWARAVALRLHHITRSATSRADDTSDGVLFLTYHDMRADEGPRFRRQLDMLRRFGDFASVSEALAHLADGVGRRVCLTFDDGYMGAFNHAVPILAGDAIPATFFLVPRWLDEGRPGIIGWEECRRLKAAGMEIGSHSLTHRRLIDLASTEVMQELAGSRARIEAETGGPCWHFACPWGQPNVDYHPTREPGIARLAGYRSFLTTVQRRAWTGANCWSLPRVRMEPGWGAAELRYAFSR